MKPTSRIIDARALRSDPSLVAELRAGSGDFVERRTFATFAELRAGGQGEPTRVVGLAAVFDSLSENLGGFREKIDRGAFRKVLGTNPDVRALVNHDPNLVFARTTVEDGPGSLRLKEVGGGLRYDAIPTETTYAADLLVNLAAGVVDQSSFAFRVASGGDSWEEDPDTGALVRTIHEFSGLYDVSPVTYPAYPSTDSGVQAGARGEGEQDGSDQGDEVARQDAGYSVAAAARSLELRERLAQL